MGAQGYSAADSSSSAVDIGALTGGFDAGAYSGFTGDFGGMTGMGGNFRELERAEESIEASETSAAAAATANLEGFKAKAKWDMEIPQDYLDRVAKMVGSIDVNEFHQ